MTPGPKTAEDILRRSPGQPPRPNPGRAVPFVKWVGGKRSLVDALIAHSPTTFNRYWEPFAGGGALYFRLHEQLTGALLSDTNPDLVAAYNAVRADPAALIDQLETHARKHCRAHYYHVRSQHDLKDPTQVAARLIYLNRTCYNGLYRVNRKGEFNVPMGSYVNPDIVRHSHITACREALQTAKIECRDFSTIRPDPGDLVYCDPPYHPRNADSFTKYTQKGFGDREQERLRDFASELHRGGVHLILSNADTPLIRDLYKGPAWRLDVVRAPRSVNSRATGRGAVDELIITNYTQNPDAQG